MSPKQDLVNLACMHNVGNVRGIGNANELSSDFVFCTRGRAKQTVQMLQQPYGEVLKKMRKMHSACGAVLVKERLQNKLEARRRCIDN